MEIIRPKGTDGPVYKAGHQHLIVGGLAFALEETAGEAACGIILFPVIYGEGHEVGTLFYFFRSAYCGQQHCATHLYDCGTVCLLGKFAGFDFNHAAVRELDLFVDDVHYCFLLRLLKKDGSPIGSHPAFSYCAYRRRPSFLTISLYLSMSTFWR